MNEAAEEEGVRFGAAHRAVPMALEAAGSPSKVCVIGLEKTGQAVTTALLGAGISVVAIEERPDSRKSAIAAELERLAASSGSAVSFVSHLGESAEIDTALFDGVGLVIPSPGVPKNSPVMQRCTNACGLAWSEVELAFRVVESRRSLGDVLPVVAVTGTNGKTTTVRLVQHILEMCGRAAVGCGNIGLPFIEAALSVPSGVWLVVEVSSFQLALCDVFRPNISVFLNFAPDHLDWHPDVDDYAASKGKIFVRQSAGDAAVYNAADSTVKRLADMNIGQEVRRIPFAVGTDEAISGGVLLREDGSISIPDGSIWRLGPSHGRASGEGGARYTVPPEDTAAALSVAIAAGIAVQDALVAIASFVPPPHRMEKVAEVSRRSFVNDSKATNPHAAETAISSYDSVVLIAGGRNKGIDLDSFASAIAGSGRVRRVVCIGESGPGLAAALSSRGVSTAAASSMERAVAEAWESSSPGDTILLSPGFASFDWYRNYEERGEHFKAAVLELVEKLVETGRARSAREAEGM